MPENGDCSQLQFKKMRNLRTLIHCIGFLFLTVLINDALAQELNIKSYTVMEGLPSSFVHKIVQDGEGRIWIASRNGISAYNGKFWKNYTKREGLGVDEFVSIAKDNSGNIWGMAKTYYIQLVHFHNDEFKLLRSPAFSQLTEDVSQNKCFAIYTDSKDTIVLIGTGQAGLIVYKNGRWFALTADQGLPSNQIKDIAENNGSFYIVTGNGIIQLEKDLSIKNPFVIIPPEDIKKFWSIKFENKGSKIWLLGESFISSVENGRYAKAINNFNMGEITKLDYPRFFPDYHGYFFFGTQRELFIDDEYSKTVSKLTGRNGSVFRGITSAMKDREDNLWITSHRGVYKISIPKFKTFNAQSGLHRNEVTAIQQTGNTIVFGHEEGISFYTNGKYEIRKFNDPSVQKADYRIMQFAKGKDEKIWIAAAKKGLGYIGKNKELKWFKIPGEIDYNVVSVAIDNDGILYAATNSAVYKFRNNRFEKMSLQDIFGGNGIRRIYINDESELLICTMGSGVIHKRNTGGWKIYSSKADLNANNVYAVCSQKGEILVGTVTGLFLVKGDSLIRHPVIKIERPIFFIGREKNNYWFGTDCGAAKWDGKELVNYTPHDNLAGLETNRGGFLVDNRGNVWIGTDKGVSKFVQADDSGKNIKPTIVFDLAGRDGRRIQFENKLEIDYSNNELAANVFVLSFLNEEQNVYIAKLENYDNEWLQEVKSGERLRYTNLPPGVYRLRIKGKNALGIWGDEYVSPDIIILSPFYRKWWFILFVIAISAAIIYFIVNYLSNAKYTLKLKKEVEERTFQLKESESKYKNLVNSLQDGVYVIRDEKIIFLNWALAEIIGCKTTAEILGSKWSDFTLEEDIPMVAERYRKRMAGEEVSPLIEFRMKHKSGKILNVVSNASLIIYENAPAVFGTMKDITKQKEREVELLKLSAAVQQSPHSVIVTNPEKIVEYVNPFFEKLSGYKSAEITGKNVDILKSGLMPETVYDDILSTVNRGEIWRGELLNQKNNKELFWVRTSIAPIKNVNGEIINLISLEEDITFEKYARQEIERKEKLLTATLEKVPVIIFFLNKEKQITFIKGNGLDLLGFPDEKELLGKQISCLFGNEETLESDLNKAAANKSFMTLTFVKEHVFEIHYSLMNQDARDDSLIIGLAVDITDYYNAELAVKEGESKINALFKALPDYIIEVDKNRIITSFHQPLEKQLSFSPESFVGVSLGSALPASFTEINRILASVFGTGESETAVFPAAAGNVQTYYEARFVLRDENHILAIVRDVTEKIIAEGELIKAKEVAERSDRLKSEFLAHMSHEIRTPVNTILNYTSLMEEELIDKLSSELKDGFKVIRDGGMRLIRTIDLILNMSQMQTGTYSPNYQYIDIDRQVLQRIITEFSYRAKRHNLELTYKVSCDSSVIYADDYTIGQIFANLIDNAIKYTKEGKIEVSLYNSGKKLVAEIADTGIGISSEYLPNLFAPFTQEEMGYTRRFDGTGLGLALVKKYVEINNAEIFVESEKGVGSKFILKFRMNSENDLDV